MYLFGDESGHLQTILRGTSEDVFVLGVVAGERYQCRGCPKAVSDHNHGVDDIHWRELTPVQKRRVTERLGDPDRQLQFGYVALEHRELTSLRYNHLLFQNDVFPIENDLAIMGHGYATILDALPVPDGTRTRFVFDQFLAARQSDRIASVIRDRSRPSTVHYADSQGELGIQAADCFCGVVRDQHHQQVGSEWWDNLSNRPIVDATPQFLDWLQQQLVNGYTDP